MSLFVYVEIINLAILRLWTLLSKDGKSSDEVVNLYGLRTCTKYPRRTMVANLWAVWKESGDGWCMKWDQSIKTLTVGLCDLGKWKPLSWSLRDYYNHWLEKLDNVDQNFS